MDIAVGNVVERISRVLAAQALSVNADGAEASAAEAVDDVWPDYIASAVGVLRTLREPDEHMAAVGDVGVWSRMIDAALMGETQ